MTIRVLQIIDNLITGGAQKLLVTLAREAPTYDLELTVISLSEDNDRIILDELADLGIEVLVFPARHLLDMRRILRLRRFITGRSFDLTQCHLTYANILGTTCSRMAGLPVVATLHSTIDVLQEFHPLVGALEMTVIRLLSRRVVAVAYTIADSFRESLRGCEIEVIPNTVPLPAPVSEQKRLKMRQELAGDVGRMIVISVGRIAPPKGYPDLLAAFSVLAKYHPGILLILVGEGPLSADIRNRVSVLDLEKNVLLLGERGDVPSLLAASDLYVSSSYYEGLPLAILEAMMAGLPIVATGVGDIPRLVTPQIGRLVPPHQPEMLASGIEELLRDPLQLREMGAVARALAIRDYSPDAWMERILKAYRQTLGYE